MANGDTPSIGEYLAVLRRRRLLMIAVALPIILIALALAVTLPDIYRSHAVFRLVTDRVTQSVADAGDYADQYVLSLADRVWGSSELEQAVGEVVPYPELKDDNSSAMSKLLDNVSISMTVQTVLEAGGRERVINTGFVVSHENPSPKKAQAMAAALATIFTDLSRTERLATANNAVRFYTSESERTSQEIADLERRLADFKEKNFERLPETAQANIGIRARLEQELDGVGREIRGLQQNRVFVMQQLRQAQAGPTVGSLRQLEDEYQRLSATYAESHPDVVTLRKQIESMRSAGPSTGGSTLQAQLNSQRSALAEARQRYSEDHPDIRRMTRNIEALEARIASGESPTSSVAGESLLAVQLQTQVNALDTQLAGLQGRNAELHRRLEQFEMRLGSTPEVEREYQSITRGLDTARQQFEQMAAGRLNAEMQASAVTGGTADRFALESKPSVPRTPYGPQRLMIAMVGLVLAAVAALSCAVAAEILDPRVRGAADIRRLMSRSPLAVVPEIHNSVFWRVRTRRAVVLGIAIVVVTPAIFAVIYPLLN